MASPTRDEGPEPFPSISEDPSVQGSPGSPLRRKSSTPNRPAASSSLSGRLRRASQSFNESGPPAGFSAATGNIASSILSRQKAPTGSSANADVPPVAMDPNASRSPASVPASQDKDKAVTADNVNPTTSTCNDPNAPAAAAPYANGYHFPPAKSFGQSTKDGLIAFWNYFLTPLGFVVTIYGLNIVAWGGMLFLLLCNAGFGLAPWRFRDLWYLLKYRWGKDQQALRRLAGIHSGWYRLPGSSSLPTDIGPNNVTLRQTSDEQSNIPYPAEKIAEPPLTGVRARDSKVWKLDLVIWLMVWNTFFQACLAGFMWGMNRHDRPDWTTGLFVALACIVAAVGGYIMFLEGKKVKSQEGVPVTDKDLKKLEQDREQGIYHYNNMKDKDLEAKKAAKEEKKAKKEAKKEAKHEASG